MAKPIKKTAKKAARKTSKSPGLGARAAKQIKGMGRVRKALVDLPEPEQAERREGYLEHALVLGAPKRPDKKALSAVRAARTQCTGVTSGECRHAVRRVAKLMGK